MSIENRAFQPGPTVTQNLAVTAGAASITLNNLSGTRSVRVVTSGTTPIFITLDGTTATTTTGMVVLGNTQQVFTVPQQSSVVSAIATATGVTLYVTVGSGKQ